MDGTLHPVRLQLFELRIIPELSPFNPTEAPEAHSVGGKKNKERGGVQRGGWGTFLITSAVFLFAQPLPSCSGMRSVLRPAINGGEHP